MSGACTPRDRARLEPDPQADEYVARLVRIKARQLVGKAGFTESDREDIEQELILHLIERLPEYDPRRSSRHTFIARVVEHKVADLIRYRTAGMRDPRRVERSLDEPVTGAEGEQADLASMTPGDERTPGEPHDAAIDLAEALEGLPPHLRALCKRLPEATIQEIADEFGVTRRTVYRWIEEIRARLGETGFGVYL